MHYSEDPINLSKGADAISMRNPSELAINRLQCIFFMKAGDEVTSYT